MKISGIGHKNMSNLAPPQENKEGHISRRPRAELKDPFIPALVLYALFESGTALALPPGFVDVQRQIPSIQVELAYAGRHNFVGRPIDGYFANRAILSKEAAAALKRVQTELAQKGLGLKIFDAYRPKKAVRHFYRWSQNPRDLLTKRTYYPELDKNQLFRQGYIARKSSHSRGSTVDLTLVRLDTGKALDMGTIFDFFSTRSWYQSKQVSPRQKANRKLLRETMMKQGFEPFPQEWWHFTLAQEPWPRHYFDFDVR
jgi:D-alanyl-D-alanine dipeptidase